MIATDPSTLIAPGFTTFVDGLLDYAIVLAAVGALSMALIEAVKKLTDARTKTHIRRWAAFMEQGTPKHIVGPALSQLLQLCNGIDAGVADNAAGAILLVGTPPTLSTTRCGGPAYAVFALPTEDFVAALRDAADVALSSPQAYAELFEFFVHGALATDIKTWTTHDPAQPAKAREGASALGRLRVIARQKLSAFETRTTQQWAWDNQRAATALGAVLLTILAWLGVAQANLSGWTFVLAPIGGVLAPVAKDVVSALQRFKADVTPAA